MVVGRVVVVGVVVEGVVVVVVEVEVDGVVISISQYLPV